MNDAQKNYTTIEKELRSIVETLREFRTMLLGAQLRVYTDHRNLTHKLTSFTTQRVMRWRLLLEEYGCRYFYKEGNQNLVADALSRVPTTRTEQTKSPRPQDQRAHQDLQDSTDHDPEDQYCMLLAQPDLADCLLSYPAFDERGRSPFHFETLQYYQQQCALTKALPGQQPRQFQLIPMGTCALICRVGKADTNAMVTHGSRNDLVDCKIVIPDRIW